MKSREKRTWYRAMEKRIALQRLLALLLLLVLIAHPAMAVVNSTVSGNASISSSATAGIRWHVIFNILLSPGTTIRGINGVISIPNGPVLATLPDIGPVSATPLGGNNSQGLLTEQVRIPQSVVLKALELGSNVIEIRRDFVESSGTSLPEAGQATLPILSNSLGGLNIGRLELRFADNSRATVVPEGKRLAARLDIHYTGKGVLQGVWEVASPPSTLGDPVFQPLKLVRRPLIGGQRATLTFSGLPTRMSGLHLVRFRITDPSAAIDTPVIRYFVTRNSTAWAPPVRILSPPPLSQLGADTRFSWESVPNATGYQLEFFEADTRLTSQALRLEEINAMRLLEGGAPLGRVAGVVLPPDRSSITLSLLSRNHLQPGKTYFWRIIAFGPSGERLAESALHRIRVP